MTKICIAGKNDIAVNAMYYLADELKINKKDIFVILNKCDDGVDSWQKSLKKHALLNNIEIKTLEDAYTIEDLIFFSLEFDLLVKTGKFKSKNLFNIHFSNLPKYKGCYTAIMPILNGEKEAGVTLHKIFDGIDDGDIIAQKLFPIEINDTAKDLYMKFNANALTLFKENFLKILKNKYVSYPQPSTESTYYSRKALDFNKINIDIKKTSFQIHNQFRAFIFKEYQLPVFQGFQIVSSELTNEFIGYNQTIEYPDRFVVSGIDGFKILLFKDKKQTKEGQND